MLCTCTFLKIEDVKWSNLILRVVLCWLLKTAVCIIWEFLHRGCSKSTRLFTSEENSTHFWNAVAVKPKMVYSVVINGHDHFWITSSLSFITGVCDNWKQIQYAGWISTPPFNAFWWADHTAAVPSSKTQQTNSICTKSRWVCMCHIRVLPLLSLCSLFWIHDQNIWCEWPVEILRNVHSFFAPSVS